MNNDLWQVLNFNILINNFMNIHILNDKLPAYYS